MYQLILIVLIALSLTSCQTQQAKTSTKVADPNEKSSVLETNTNLIVPPTPEYQNSDDVDKLIETFSNETEIGNPKRNKIELSSFGNSDESIVEIKFYSKNKDEGWKINQTLKIEKFGSMPLQADLSDFNNDGFKDFTFISESSARGANELRKLLIYDKKKDELIHIINSDEYPNLGYNKKLDCLTTMRYYGGFSTEFLKIDGNKLKEFASIETFDGVRKVYLTDNNGKTRLIRTDKVNPRDGFIQYETFDPPN